MTPAVYELDPQLRGRAIWAVARYERFDPDSEHNWGVFIFAGYSFEWHIEYRSANGPGLSPDPADPAKTLRVLTLYIAADLLAKTKGRTRTDQRAPLERYTSDRNASSLRPASLMIFFMSGHRAD